MYFGNLILGIHFNTVLPQTTCLYDRDNVWSITWTRQNVKYTVYYWVPSTHHELHQINNIKRKILDNFFPCQITANTILTSEVDFHLPINREKYYLKSWNNVAKLEFLCFKVQPRQQKYRFSSLENILNLPCGSKFARN